jgi:hypothetical protein
LLFSTMKRFVSNLQFSPFDYTFDKTLRMLKNLIL